MGQPRLDEAMNPQLHINVDSPRPELVEPITQGLHIPKGGLWTSTPILERDSFFVTLYASIDPVPNIPHRWRHRAGRRYRCWWLYPSPSARVAVIDSRSDLTRLVENYGWLPGYGAIRTLNYTALAKDFDALRVTDRAVDELETPGAGQFRLAEWLAESTCWFRWCFEQVDEKGTLASYLKVPGRPQTDWAKVLRVMRDKPNYGQ